MTTPTSNQPARAVSRILDNIVVQSVQYTFSHNISVVTSVYYIFQ